MHMHDKLDSMRYAGRVNLGAINYAFGLAKPGVKLIELDAGIEWYIRQAGCTPAFKGYQPEGYSRPYPNTACISPNDVVVHGIPGNYVLRQGDLLTIDVGTEHEGWFVDAARTRLVPGRVSKEAVHLVEAVDAIMDAELAVVRNECTFLRMIEAADAVAKAYGVTIMPQWGGHGIGEKIHLPPFVPNAIDKSKSRIKQDLEVKKYGREKFVIGETYCIEPVTTMGTSGIMIDEDGWTVRQAERRLTAHTERCLLVTEEGYELLS